MMSSLFEELSRSVVQVVVRSRAPRAFQPWDYKFQEAAGASAVVVDGSRLLTCAHVVAHAVHIHVLKPGDERKYKASVVALDHDRELALLAVDDRRFFDGMVAVSFGGLPLQQDTITVWGYPTGGSTLSSTAGVVSRIEMIGSSHARRSMLALETDARVTLGNSGGPAFLAREVVGVVFQGAGDESRTSHLIPTPVIKTFFDDLADGAISGVPDLGVYWQKIENDDLKMSLGLGAAESGVLVVSTVPGSSVWGVLQEGDVITSLDGRAVAGDGTVRLRERQRVDFSAVIGEHQVGETISLEILRQGVRHRVEVVLAPLVALVRPFRSGQVSRYFIHGGFVFQPLTHDYLEVWQDRIDARLVAHAKYGLPSETRAEIVVLSQVLAHDVNAGYHDVAMLVVTRINDTVIRHLGDLQAAFERPRGRYHVVEVEGRGRREVGGVQEFGSRIVIDAARARAVHADILAQHGISSDRSAELDPP